MPTLRPWKPCRHNNQPANGISTLDNVLDARWSMCEPCCLWVASPGQFIRHPEVQSKAFRQIPPRVVIYFWSSDHPFQKSHLHTELSSPRPSPWQRSRQPSRPTMTCLPRSAPANNFLRRSQSIVLAINGPVRGPILVRVNTMPILVLVLLMSLVNDGTVLVNFGGGSRVRKKHIDHNNHTEDNKSHVVHSPRKP
ncbi:hypothetical protein BDV36DRAFT_61482 [Aspergillus pseudocaelatus]|uniref:Uncharacterized protein n=1 Tax=Aspergillus pseudocaelatus TaxID=1825620 RepID=A0ABQ6WA21_9EURO|nr:hypothetical protein BDV36DRAFT_61482 [Aspergillus pseudocaelatus]